MNKKNPLNSKMVFARHHYELEGSWIELWERKPNYEESDDYDDVPNFRIVLCGGSLLSDEWVVVQKRFHKVIFEPQQVRSYTSEEIPGFRLCRTTTGKK